MDNLSGVPWELDNRSFMLHIKFLNFFWNRIERWKDFQNGIVKNHNNAVIAVSGQTWLSERWI